jgi:hypothetical protein
MDIEVLPELELNELRDTVVYEARVNDAIDLASDQDQGTWLTEDGKRIAAIVPVDVLEQHLNWLREVMTGEQWRDKPPFVVGYDDAMNGRPQSVRWGDKLDVARYQAGYGIGTLDGQRAAERRS